MSSDSELRRSPAYVLEPTDALSDEQLLAFAASVFPDQPPEPMLQAWWRDADPSCAVAAIHEATGAVAGLCVGRPSTWTIAGTSAPGVAICGWYVAPDHGGRLIGRRLVRHFQKPDRLLYAYSMSEDAVRYLSRLGWVGPYTSSLFVLPAPRAASWVHQLRRRNRNLDLAEHDVASPTLPGPLGASLETIAEQMDQAPYAHMRRGRAEWTWRLSVCGTRHYRFCVASRSDKPIAYLAARRVTPGASRILGKRPAAIITDLVVPDGDSAIAMALIERAVRFAADFGAVVTLAATTVAAESRWYTALGFLSSDLPVVGSMLARRAPQFMWLPRGPGEGLNVDTMALSFSDSDVDLSL